MSSSTQALTLSVPSTLYCAGSDVEGEVLLDFRQVQQENIQHVHIKLKGSVHTTVKRDKRTVRQTIPLIHSSLDLWTQGSAYPPPGTDILHLPFRFRLPDNIPPSFHYRAWQKSAYVFYELSAVGVRPGTFQFNRKQRMPLAVVPKDEIGVQLRERIPSLGWRKGEKVEKIRKGLWGDYATVHVELLFPDTPVFPLFTDIPFIINVTTTTALLSRSKADAHPENKPIFPAPPAMHTEVNFRLSRIMRIRAQRYGSESVDDVAYFLGANTDPSQVAVETDLPPKEWVIVQPGGGGEEKGVWIQRARFQTSVRFSLPPTFLALTVECLYMLDLHIPFPGIGNDLRMNVPVTIVSGIDAPLTRMPETKSHAASPAQTYVPQPSSMLDLPPAYWDVNSQGWGDHDEKN